jgi:hypothetical protein
LNSSIFSTEAAGLLQEHSDHASVTRRYESVPGSSNHLDRPYRYLRIPSDHSLQLRAGEGLLLLAVGTEAVKDSSFTRGRGDTLTPLTGDDTPNPFTGAPLARLTMY